MTPETPFLVFDLALTDEAATLALGSALADTLLLERASIERAGLVVSLHGDLGTGKTTLIRALLRRCGVEGSIKSPTFALLEPYEVVRLHFYHFDFYRFKSPTEFLDGGFDEYFRPGAVCLVEWPERAGDALPRVDVSVDLQLAMPGRTARVAARSESGAQCLKQLKIVCARTAGAG